jgi:nucleoside-diphosphate-sugar epimerase
MKTALVSGCAGFIGSHVTDRLLTAGYNVVGVDNLRTGTLSNLVDAMPNPNFTFIEKDITSEEFLGSVEGDISVVFHLAAIASVALSVEDPMLINKHNVTGTLRVLELAKQKRAKRVVFTSSAAVYGDPSSFPIKESFPLRPLSPYAASKIAGECYVRAFGATFDIEQVILRLFNVYGPRQEYSEYSGVIAIFAHRATNGLPLEIEGDGLQTRSFINVDDVSRAIQLAGEVPEANGQIINISNTESVSVLSVAEAIREQLGVEIVHREPRLGDIRDSIGDMTLAGKVLGVKPTVPFADGLKRTLAWYRQQAGLNAK